MSCRIVFLNVPSAIVIQRLIYGSPPPATTLLNNDDELEEALALAA
jgi:hypothetical protein